MLHIDIDITSIWQQNQHNIDWEQTAQQAIASALENTPYAALVQHKPHVSIRMSDNQNIQQLNKQWRGYDKPTNVLAFPQWQSYELNTISQAATPEALPTDFMPSEFLLGDIILAHETCQDEAEEKNIPLEHHVSHLFVHAALHLLGYDHKNNSTANAMEALEIKALAKLAIDNPYRA